MLKGSQHSEETRRRIRESCRKRTPDQAVTYTGIHAWISRNWGPANCCELCGKTNLTGQQAHWASKDHKYTRERSDWMMLCRPCHAAHDKEYNGTSFRNSRAGNTHCPRGHEYTPENTKTYNGCRKCLTCNREKMREYYHRKKSKP